MKRYLSTILATALTIGCLSGCGAPSTSSAPAESGAPASGAASSETAPKGGGEITIMGNARMYDGEEAAWNEVTADFTAKTGIKVNLRWQGKWDEVPQNLAAAKMAGESVDLVTVGAGLINSSVASSGMLMDITTLMEPNRAYFKDGMLDAYTIGGKLWGFPYGNSAAGFIYYNKTMFDELGLSEPKTFDELVAVSGTIKEKKGIIPMIFRGKDASYWPNWLFSTLAQTTGNQSVDKVKSILAGSGKFTDPEVVQALALIKPFFDEGVVAKESLDTNGDGMKATFLQGKAAMMHTHNFQLLPDQCDFELGILEFPLVVNNGAFSQPSGGPGTGIAVPSFADRDNLGNTMQFVEFLLQPENANKIISCYKPVVDVVKGVQVLDEPIVKELNDELIPKTIVYLDWIWPAKVQDAFMQAIPSMIAGNITPEQAAENAQKALDDIIAQDGYQFEWWNSWNEEKWSQVTP